jgi:holo-[acyl-carrier protein] synthase
MIFGIGTDICDIRRVEATWQRQGERFVRKVLTDAEFAVWQTRSARWPQRGLRYLATRFSPEAFSNRPGMRCHWPGALRDHQPAQRPTRRRAAR